MISLNKLLLHLVKKNDSTNKDFEAQKAIFEQELLPVKEYDDIKEGKSVNISGKTYHSNKIVPV